MATTPARPTPQQRVDAALKAQTAKGIRPRSMYRGGLGLTAEAEAAVVAARARWVARFQVPPPADSTS